MTRFRAELGWTQADLATKSGFTERLIRKAESGKPLRRNSLRIIAQTLAEGMGQELTIEELIDDPLPGPALNGR